MYIDVPIIRMGLLKRISRYWKQKKGMQLDIVNKVKESLTYYLF